MGECLCDQETEWCEICLDMKGFTGVPVEHYRWSEPPKHFNCRCVLDVKPARLTLRERVRHWLWCRVADIVWLFE